MFVIGIFFGNSIKIRNFNCCLHVDSCLLYEWESSFSDIDSCKINVTGLALTAKYALPELRKSNGRLGWIGSVAAFVPNSNLDAYGASKAAVQNIGETLQSELLGS